MDFWNNWAGYSFFGGQGVPIWDNGTALHAFNIAESMGIIIGNNTSAEITDARVTDCEPVECGTIFIN